MNLIKQVLEQELTAGFKLEQDDQDEGDVIKIYHYITDPSGKKHWLDHNPYDMIDPETFANYVKYFKKHGKFPDREDLNIFGPLDHDDVAKAAAE